MKVPLDKRVRECSAKEIVEVYSLHMIGASKKLRAYRALTLDPFFPNAVFYGIVSFGAIPITSPYWFMATQVAVEYAAENSPPEVRGEFTEMRLDQTKPRIGTPTLGSDGNEYYDNTEEYERRLNAVLAVAGTLDRAWAGMLTLLGWSAGILSHVELGEYQVSDEIFSPDRFTITPFYEAWLESHDIEGLSIEAEMLSRLRRGDVALIHEWDRDKAIVWRKDRWVSWHSGRSSVVKERKVLKVLHSIPCCSLLPIPAAEAYLKHSLM